MDLARTASKSWDEYRLRQKQLELDEIENKLKLT